MQIQAVVPTATHRDPGQVAWSCMTQGLPNVESVCCRVGSVADSESIVQGAPASRKFLAESPL